MVNRVTYNVQDLYNREIVCNLWNTIAKRYLNGEADIHFHFWVTTSEHYCIFSQRSRVRREISLSSQGCESGICAANNSASSNCRDCDHIEMSMFVSVMEAVKPP